MAKKPAAEQITAAEATRQSWKELGNKAQGTDVAKLVKTKYGHDVASSTVSMAKKTVFGKKIVVKRKSSAAPASPASGLPVELKSKSDTVRELLAGGLESPKEIVAAAKKLGVLVTSNHVSMIKGNLKKAGGKKKRAAPAGTAAPVAVAAPSTTAPASNLELENAALKLALKAGSVQAAIQALGQLE